MKFECYVLQAQATEEGPDLSDRGPVHYFHVQPRIGDYVSAGTRSGAVVGFLHFGEPKPDLLFTERPCMIVSRHVKPDYLVHLELMASETPSS